MEFMFTPVRGKIQKGPAMHSTPIRSGNIPINMRVTPIRSKITADCGRCAILKRLEQDLCCDIPVVSSPRLEIVRKRVTSNHCKAIQRRKEKMRCQQNDAILSRKRLRLKEKDRLLAKKYAELRKMAAILNSSNEELVQKTTADNRQIYSVNKCTA